MLTPRRVSGGRSSDDRPAHPAFSWPTLGGVVALGVLGLAMLFHPLISSGFARVPGDLGDSRFNHYLLEHSWQWLQGRPDHATFWDLPIYHPASRNVTAFSDAMIGGALPYWAARFVSLDATAAYQLWFLSWAAANYALAFFVLRRLIGAHWFASAIGAFLFAFGGERATQVHHAQLMPHAFSVVCVGALALLISTRAPHPLAAWVAGLAAAAQFWAAYYLGFFLAAGVAVFLLAALPFPDTRRELGAAARRNGLGLLSASLAALAVLVPLAMHYGQAAARLPPRPYDHTFGLIPTLDSWLRMGPGSLVYGWLERPEFLARIHQRPSVPIGAGWVTTTCAVLGLWQGRQRRWIRTLLLASVALVLLTLRLGPMTPWRAIYDLLPGASAVRAVFRVAILMLLPMAVGVALFLARRRRAWVAALFAVAIVVEQGTRPTTYEAREAEERAAWIAQRVTAECGSFLFVPVKPPDIPVYPALFYHVDAMMAQLALGKPTLNGYSGNAPPRYNLYEIVVRAPEHSADVRARLRTWAARNGLDLSSTCVIEEPFPFV